MTYKLTALILSADDEHYITGAMFGEEAQRNKSQFLHLAQSPKSIFTKSRSNMIHVLPSEATLAVLIWLYWVTLNCSSPLGGGAGYLLSTGVLSISPLFSVGRSFWHNHCYFIRGKLLPTGSITLATPIAFTTFSTMSLMSYTNEKCDPIKIGTAILKITPNTMFELIGP